MVNGFPLLMENIIHPRIENCFLPPCSGPKIDWCNRL